MLSVCDFSDVELRICDSYNTGSCFDFVVECPDQELCEWADAILPTMFYDRGSFYDSIAQYGIDDSKIISIYSDDDTVPINCISVDLSPECCEDICDESEIGIRDKYKEWTVSGLAQNYDFEVENNFFEKVIAPAFKEYLKKQYYVLDFGAGSGRLSLVASNNGCKVTAVDINPEFLDIIKMKDDRIETVLTNGNVLPFAEDSFHVVMSYDVIIHLSDWREHIKEQFRVLRKGGYMIHGILNDDHLKRFSLKKHVRQSYISGDYKNYMTTISKDELEEICNELGMEIVEQRPINFFHKSAYSFGVLTRWEMLELGSYITQLCKNEEFLDVISKFENEIIAELPPESSAYNIVVLKKI